MCILWTGWPDWEWSTSQVNKSRSQNLFRKRFLEKLSTCWLEDTFNRLKTAQRPLNDWGLSDVIVRQHLQGGMLTFFVLFLRISVHARALYSPSLLLLVELFTRFHTLVLYTNYVSRRLTNRTTHLKTS